MQIITTTEASIGKQMITTFHSKDEFSSFFPLFFLTLGRPLPHEVRVPLTGDLNVRKMGFQVTGEHSLNVVGTIGKLKKIVRFTFYTLLGNKL